MTLIGKLLSFLNLIVGLGLLTWAVTTFTLRPGFFDPLTEEQKARPTAADSGGPVTFAGEKAKVDAYFRQANLASGAWGAGFKALRDLEDRRDDRRKVFAQRLGWAVTGRDKSGIGFFNEQDPGVIPVAPEAPLRGPDNLPLKGSDLLKNQLSDDVAAHLALAKQVEAARLKYAELTAAIGVEQARLWAMTTIRDEVQAEAFYLAAVEVNAYETRETVFRRKRQLDRRLAELGGK